MATASYRIAACLLLVLASASACDEPADAWWEGTGEPDRNGKADGNDSLTIFLNDHQTEVRRILSEPTIGATSRAQTGKLDLDGLSLSDDVVLVFRGELFRYDGEVDEIDMAIAPEWISHEDGAANEAGFLDIDFKDGEKVANASGDAPLGVHAGVFRGEIVATTDLALGEPLPDDLSTLYIRPDNAFERPPNRLTADIHVTPVVTLARLTPGDGDPCLGVPVVSRTLSYTDLNLEVGLDGFPTDEPVEVTVSLRTPNEAFSWEQFNHRLIEATWDFFESFFFDYEEEESTKTVTGEDVVDFGTFRTAESNWGAEVFAMEIEVRANMASLPAGFAPSYTHELIVADTGAKVAIDQFELCPRHDKQCHERRDEHAADNVRAHRAVTEHKAHSKGLYNRVTRALSGCEGGDVVANDFSQACRLYSEEQDTELSGRVAASLEFELTVNGEAKGEASWGGSVDGLGSAEIEGQFQAAFSLEAELDASFETSRTWRDKSSLDVMYKPKETRLQWWRVATPRIYYLELAEFNECGQAIDSDEIFLSDLRDSQLVLGCEAVTADDFDKTCHAVEPTREAAEACNELLIDPDSSEGRACFDD